MTATIFSPSGNYTFGQMSTQTISRLIAINTQIARIRDAIATASSGYVGVPGTEFEVPGGYMTMPNSVSGPNLFGVVPGATPGTNGTDYAYAMNSLATAWDTFWTTASPFIEQLDNGGGST